MKTLLTITLCLCACLAVYADEGPPPQPQGSASRFQVVSGMVDHGSGPVPTFVRIDTHTGRSWIMQTVPLPGNRSAYVNVWIPNHELGSEVYQAAIAALTKTTPPPPPQQ